MSLDLSTIAPLILEEAADGLLDLLEDHAGDLLGAGVEPGTVAVLVGSLADSLIDFEDLIDGPVGSLLEQYDGPAIAKALALGEGLVRRAMSPERREARQASRAVRQSTRQARRAARRSS